MNSPRNIWGEGWSHCAGVVFWHGNDTCFTIPPFPFSFGGVDLSTAAGEKWVFRTLPPPLRGRVNERVAKKKGGGGGAGGRGRRNLVSEHRSHATHVHHWNSRPGLIFPSWLKLEKKLANYHNILYSDRTQLNYLGGKKVKQNRSESVFNCSWYAVQKQVALLNHLRASTAQGGASLKNNNTL